VGYRHPNPRLVKIHRNYSVEEIARLFGLHKNTIRNWLKQELAAIDDHRPMLILGRELSRFLQERRQRGKQSCGPGRIYCIACREPKVPAGNMADCIATSPSAGNLCGICPTAIGSCTGASTSAKLMQYEAVWRSRSNSPSRA
jgi:predicted transcriptional regulator